MRAKLAALALCCSGLAFTAACGDDDERPNRTPIDTTSFADAPQMTPADGVPQATRSGLYRDDLANHYGCTPRASYAGTTESLVDNSVNVAARAPSTPANIPGYTCAANEYTQENEDTSKPIVILVHGNSSSPGSFEEYDNVSRRGNTYPTASGTEVVVDSVARQQLASKLVAAGYRVYGFDARTDLIGNNDPQNAQNASHNMDHGWSVPMLQSMIKAVMKANPNRKVSLLGHSLGVTEIRDALRRLFVEYGQNPNSDDVVNPYAQIQDLLYISGANHGVSYFGNAQACTLPVPTDATSQMTVYVNCELGNRDAFQPTYFSAPITGVNDVWATPCADGQTAFGQTDACDGNTVEYTTLVMEDLPDGRQQDEFVSEESAALVSGQPIDNHLVPLSDDDTSGYFFDNFPAFFANHFGSIRNDNSMAYILEKLAD